MADIDIKRFLESQISRSFEATRRTSSGISRNQDRDRLHFYQARLAEAKAGNLDVASFERNLSSWSGGGKHDFALDVQSSSDTLFRSEVLADYRDYQRSTGARERELLQPESPPRGIGTKSLIAIATVPLLAIIGGSLVGAAALANAGPFDDDEEPTRRSRRQVEATATAGSSSTAEVVVPPDSVDDEETSSLAGDAPIQRLIIESAAIDNSSILTLGLQDDDSTFEVPTNATQIAWYDFSGLPVEEERPTVPILAAHVDYRGQDGAFKSLVDAAPGTFLYLVMADETIYKYEIVSNRDIAKTVLTWEDLGCDPEQCFIDGALTLITCGGNFNPRTRSYTDNVVVRANLIGEVEATELPV